jgi:hypothetical protein
VLRTLRVGDSLTARGRGEFLKTFGALGVTMGRIRDTDNFRTHGGSCLALSAA